MATEKLKFKLVLHATMWNKPPHVEVKLNGESFYSGDITGTEDKPAVIEFEHELNEGENYSLEIHRSGKGRNETVINEKGDILNDQLLNIKGIEIDEIDIGGLVYEGVYEPTYPEPWATQQKEAGFELQKTMKNVTSMGHNGVWRFKFQSPFYMWLLENLY